MKGGSRYKISRDAYLPLEALQQWRYLLAQILERKGRIRKQPFEKERERKHSLGPPRNSFEFSGDYHYIKQSWSVFIRHVN